MVEVQGKMMEKFKKYYLNDYSEYYRNYLLGGSLSYNRIISSDEVLKCVNKSLIFQTSSKGCKKSVAYMSNCYIF